MKEKKITLITGRAGSGKSEEILRRIREALEAGRKRLILFVPEQQAVVWERRAAKRLPPEVLAGMSDETFAERAFSWRGRKVLERNMRVKGMDNEQ